MNRVVLRLSPALLCALAAASPATAQTAFWNWETPHVHPLDLTPDGTTLLAVNTADNRLEVFTIAGGLPVLSSEIPVGLEPVSVRASSNTEAWVINHVSDTISIVDLTNGRVKSVIGTGDEPTDVVFANGKAFVTVSQLNQVRVWSLANLAASPTIITIQGEEPRGLAVSPDGARVYVGIFESGNKTTVVADNVVSQLNSPYAGQNPPPNSGASFNPPIAVPNPPPVAQIVRQNAAGQWMDDNNRNWSGFVTWGLHDHDVGIIDTSTLALTYATGLMTNVMALGVTPGGVVTAVGTEATNEIRFEPNVQSTFIRARLGSFSPGSPSTTSTADLNPHLSYAVRTIPQSQRNLSVGDPRGIVWSPGGLVGYVSGMGSNNVIAIDTTGARLGQLAVGQGPTGLAISADGNRLYVLNKFDGTISTVDTSSTTNPSELSRTAFYDPTPTTIKLGRPLLYDTHATSGLGQASCASCHIDGRTDHLAWDLGNPAGTSKTVDEPCRQGPNNCRAWHPMKGPMVTQTLQQIVGNNPLHWRGDRENVSAFSVAFTGLQGADAEPTATQLQQFTDFLATMHMPPNPFRNQDNTLSTSLATPDGTGNASNGSNLFATLPTLGGGPCTVCHQGPRGTNPAVDFPPAAPGIPQTLKISPLMNMYEKTGFSRASTNNNKGFGFNHDSRSDTLLNVLQVGFTFAPGPQGNQQRLDIEAFLLSFATDTHPSIGRQLYLDGANSNSAGTLSTVSQFLTLANANSVGMIAKGKINGIQRGWTYVSSSGIFQSDRAAETITEASLRALATVGGEITYTLVPVGTERRMGIDRDADGALDRDELDLGYNPADPASIPPACPTDLNGDHITNTLDLGTVLSGFGQSVPPHTAGDINGDGVVNTVDLALLLNKFGIGC